LVLRDSRTWSNRRSYIELKQASYHLPVSYSFLQSLPAKTVLIKIPERTWSNLNSIVNEIHPIIEPTNYQPHDEIELKYWLMIRNCWIYFSEESVKMPQLS
jgi:hypothetical protein